MMVIVIGATALACPREKTPSPAPPTSTTTASARERADVSKLVEAIADPRLGAHRAAGMAPKEGVLDALVEAFRKRSAEDRLEFVDFLAAYGAGPARMVVRADVTTALVALLADPVEEVRSAASRRLAQTADTLVRKHQDTILDTIDGEPDLANALRLLGRTRASRTLPLYEKHFSNRAIELRLPVLAKLGDRDAEDSLLEGYVKHVRAKEPDDVERWVETLGYVATPRALRLLAEDLRSAGRYRWRHGAFAPVRLQAARGLALARPMAFMAFPNLENNANFAKIEAWATRELGVTWSEPQPPFSTPDPAPTYPDGTH